MVLLYMTPPNPGEIVSGVSVQCAYALSGNAGYGFSVFNVRKTLQVGLENVLFMNVFLTFFRELKITLI